MEVFGCGGESWSEGFTHVVSSCIYANIRDLHKNLSNLSLIARSGDVFFSETLVSPRPHISELMVPGFGKPMQLLRGEVDWVQGSAVYVRDDFSAYRQLGYECGCCVKICSSSHNFYVFGVFRNLDISDNIFDCLLTTKAKVQSVDRKAFFMFVADVNVHHEKWLGSSTTNLHGTVTSPHYWVVR